MTAAGIEVENVRPALSPKNTLAAVKITVMTTPMATPRQVSSGRSSAPRAPPALARSLSFTVPCSFDMWAPYASMHLVHQPSHRAHEQEAKHGAHHGGGDEDHEIVGRR